MTAREHNKMLGILFLAYLGLQVIGFILAILMMLGMTGFMLNSIPESEKAFFTIMMVAVVIGILISALLIIPAGVAAFRMLKERPKARGWGIAASIIALFNIPLGTALGIYGLWFLFSEEGKAYYLGAETPSMLPPPPPNSWQYE